MATINLVAIAASQAGASVVLDCTDRCHVEPLCDLLPHGPMWPREEDTTLHKLCSALSLEFSRVDKRIEAMLRESYPDTAQETLEDWERICGIPNTCTGAIAPTVAERQQDVVNCITQNSALNLQLFTDIAADLGYPAPVVTKNAPFCTGVNCAGDPLCGVDALLTVTLTFPTGAENVLLACLIRQWWTPVFSLIIVFTP